MGENKSRKRVFRSMTEFEKEFLPDSYKKRIENNENENPEVSGAKVATELLENIRRKLEISLIQTPNKS
jgi:hypothetical protein